MQHVVSSVCILIAILSIALTLYRAFIVALQHAYRMKVMQNDHDRQMTMLRTEQSHANRAEIEAAEAKRKVEIPLGTLTVRVTTKRQGDIPAAGSLENEIR